MINPGNGSRWGIKPSGINITADIHEIIDNANDFIVVCGYNFSPYNHPASIIPRLIAKRQEGLAVLIIMPPNLWGFGNANHTNNIQYLINNGIGVILNSRNHSKWIITDFGYYYGSLNFTATSMTTKIEVVSICNTLQQSGIPWWMNQTKQELLRFAVYELKNFGTATRNLGAVNAAALARLRLVFSLILRYNPEIEKVETTLLNYEDVRIDLSSLVDSYFTLISLEDLENIWRLVNEAVYVLDRLASRGNDILLKYNRQMSIRGDIAEYNRIHSNFIRIIEQLIDFIEAEQFKINIHDKLISYNKRIEKKLSQLLENDNEV